MVVHNRLCYSCSTLHHQVCIVFLFYSPEISTKADALVVGSKRFRNQATLLNLRTSLAAKLAIGVVIFLILIFLKFWFF